MTDETFDRDAWAEEADETIVGIKNLMGHGQHDGYQFGASGLYCGCGEKLHPRDGHESL